MSSSTAPLDSTLVPATVGPVWLVKVTGLYCRFTRAGYAWLCGDPAKATRFTTPEEARASAQFVRDSRQYLGRVRVVKRKHLRAPQSSKSVASRGSTRS